MRVAFKWIDLNANLHASRLCLSAFSENRQAFAFADHLLEAAEQIVAVLRAGRGIRVMLDGECLPARCNPQLVLSGQ